jgi:phosphoribosylaminoimidazole carboxylase
MTTKIGIIGGGQLGKMLVESFPLVVYDEKDVELYVLDPSFDCPCAKLPNVNFVQGDLNDSFALRHFCGYCDVVTFETENVNADELLKIEDTKFYPSPKMLKTIQNKYTQNLFYKKIDVLTPSFELVVDPKQCLETSSGKIVAKLIKGGYDGKGVKIFDLPKNPLENQTFYDDFYIFSQHNEILVEEYISDKREVSVLISRDQNGTVNTWPIVEMIFDENHNILDYMYSPSSLSESVTKNAYDIAKRVITEIDGVGVFAIEMFVDENGRIYVNEIAPRPHNSAHHTLLSCNVSVYQTLAEILCGHRNKEHQNEYHRSSALKNIIGKHYGLYRIEKNIDDYDNDNFEIDISDYNKSVSKPQRKLGHITVVNKHHDTEEGRDSAIEVLQRLTEKRKVVEISTPKVGVVMGSTSDWKTMISACEILEHFGINYEKLVVSAHRTPNRLYEYAQTARDRYIGVIIAGAGGAAHLPGMLASLTTVPVIGVPVKTSTMSGLDSLYSIVQMPPGVPVATVSIGGSKNAGILAAQILSLADNTLCQKLKDYKQSLEDKVSFTSNELPLK